MRNARYDQPRERVLQQAHEPRFDRSAANVNSYAPHSSSPLRVGTSRPRLNGSKPMVSSYQPRTEISCQGANQSLPSTETFFLYFGLRRAERHHSLPLPRDLLTSFFLHSGDWGQY